MSFTANTHTFLCWNSIKICRSTKSKKKKEAFVSSCQPDSPPPQHSLFQSFISGYLLSYQEPKKRVNIESTSTFFAALYYRDCMLVSKTEVNHNTFMFRLQLPRGTVRHVPVGKHVYLKALVQGKQPSTPHYSDGVTVTKSDAYKTFFT